MNPFPLQARARFPACLVALALVAIPACATKKEAPQAAQKPFILFHWLGKLANIIPKKTGPPVAAPPAWAGSIRMVNAGEKFVLIESHTPSLVIPGETYLAISNGKETASLRMTPLKNSPFLIADILSGNPSPGEKIYRPVPSARPPAPPPAPQAKKKPSPIPTTAPPPSPTSSPES